MASRRRIRIAVTATSLLSLLGVLAAVQASAADERGRYYPGKFVWFDLVTDDLATVQRFYGEVFGWSFDTVGAAPAFYTYIEDGGERVGGMFFHVRPAGATTSARWLSLISVPDPAEALRFVEQHGGSVVVPPATIAGRGTHALFRDPQGAVFGVLRSEAGDPPDTPVRDGDFFWVDLLARDPAAASA